MDGFTGFKTATTEELPDAVAVAVMDPFHVVRLAGDALDRCRRRVQQDIHGHRGRKGNPLYSTRRTLHTGADLLTEKQKDRLAALFDGDQHVQVEATRSRGTPTATDVVMPRKWREPALTRAFQKRSQARTRGSRSSSAAWARDRGIRPAIRLRSHTSAGTSCPRPHLWRPPAPGYLPC